MVRPDDLPDYDKPPIDEVVLGLQFDPIPSYTDVHTGLFWQRLRSQYPRAESHPRIDTPIENLNDGTVQAIPELHFLLTPDGAPRSGRTWLISEDDATLIQVQDSQFLRNWRHRTGGYPHLDDLVREFWAAYDIFSTFLDEESLNQPTHRQLEVSYFNWITGMTPGEFFKLAIASADALDPLRLEDTVHQLRAVDFVDDRPVARLSVESGPVLRATAEGIITKGSRLTLTYRAPLPASAAREDIDELVARGRNAIVNTFTSLTTPKAHELWERTK